MIKNIYLYFRQIIVSQIKKIIFFVFRQKIRGYNNSFSFSKSVSFTNTKIDVLGNSNKIIISEHCSFRNVTFFIRGNNNLIRIFPNVNFYRGGYFWIEDDGCAIEIGKNTSVEDAHIAATEPGSKICIGEDCMFAYDIDIRTGDSHSIMDSKTNRRINYSRNITIRDHVWVAAHCTILKGVDLMRNSVIATRSVVTESFNQEGVIIGGSPAKVLKENIFWDRRRIYE